MRAREPAIADLLGSYPTFAACEHHELAELAGLSGPFLLPPRWSFLHQGTPAHELYVITEGRAQVYRDRVPIAELGAGDVVGEMAFFGSGQRQATVSSIDRLRGLRIPYQVLAELRSRRPGLV